MISLNESFLKEKFEDKESSVDSEIEKKSKNSLDTFSSKESEYLDEMEAKYLCRNQIKISEE